MSISMWVMKVKLILNIYLFQFCVEKMHYDNILSWHNLKVVLGPGKQTAKYKNSNYNNTI